MIIPAKLHHILNLGILTPILLQQARWGTAFHNFPFLTCSFLREGKRPFAATSRCNSDVPWNMGHTRLALSSWTTSGSIFLLKHSWVRHSSHISDYSYQAVKGARGLDSVKETREICIVDVCVYVFVCVCVFVVLFWNWRKEMWNW